MTNSNTIDVVNLGKESIVIKKRVRNKVLHNHDKQVIKILL